jgi:hypothetical protein
MTKNVSDLKDDVTRSDHAIACWSVKANFFQSIAVQPTITS